MQYKVPQNVDIEDRVIGPLSLRQFMIILIAAGIIVFFNFIFVGYLRMLFWFFALIIGAVAGVLAFAKYGDQNAEVFLLGALKTLGSPRQRVWKKEVAPQVQEAPKTEAVTKISQKARPINEVRDDLNRLAQLVDTGGTIGVSEKDRYIAFENQQTEDKTTPDLLAQAENTNTAVSEFIDKTKAAAREPLISEVATVSPDQKFDYDKVEIKKRNQA